MEVQDLAPALLALADLIQIANQRFNGSHASMKVLVNADVEQKCFMIDISLVQTFLEQAKGLLGADGVKTAKYHDYWQRKHDCCSEARIPTSTRTKGD
jgi:hypothetical protein